MRQSYKTFFLWAVLILLFFSFFQFFRTKSGSEPREIDASEFYQAVECGSALFQGLCDATSNHDEGWQLQQWNHCPITNRTESNGDKDQRNC